MTIWPNMVSMEHEHRYWFDMWASLAGALASDLVMGYAIRIQDSELRRLAYQARGVSRTGYGQASDFALQYSAEKCVRYVMDHGLMGSTSSR